MADPADAQVVDPGVDENIAKLTPERIEQVITRVLRELDRTYRRVKEEGAGFLLETWNERKDLLPIG